MIFSLKELSFFDDDPHRLLPPTGIQTGGVSNCQTNFTILFMKSKVTFPLALAVGQSFDLSCDIRSGQVRLLLYP